MLRKACPQSSPVGPSIMLNTLISISGGRSWKRAIDRVHCKLAMRRGETWRAQPKPDNKRDRSSDCSCLHVQLGRKEGQKGLFTPRKQRRLSGTRIAHSSVQIPALSNMQAGGANEIENLGSHKYSISETCLAEKYSLWLSQDRYKRCPLAS